MITWHSAAFVVFVLGSVQLVPKATANGFLNPRALLIVSATIPYLAWAIGSSLQILWASSADLTVKLDVARALFTNTIYSRHSYCCEALARVSDVIYPETESYENYKATWFAAQQAEIQPACVVRPKDKWEVAKTILILTAGEKHRESGHTCKFAIRGGGHSPTPGVNTMKDGVTIDLTKLNQVVIADDKETANIGPGGRWAKVYDTLGAQGLAVTGGRVAGVGVGGLTTGGGVSFFSPRYGFACNGVVSFEVVLSSGEIVNASAASHTDLWRALKGGHGNFGVVTNFQMKTFPLGDFWGGSLVSPIDSKEQQYKLFEDFANAPVFDPYAALIHSYAYSEMRQSWFVSNNMQYTKSDPPDTNPTVFRPFRDLPIWQDSTRISNLTDKTQELYQFSPNGFRQLFTTATYSARADMIKAVVETGISQLESIKDAPGLVFAMTFQPLPTVFTEKASATGGDSLGLNPDRDGNLMNALLSVQWDKTEDDERITKVAKRLFEESNKVAKEKGWFNKYLYLNYAASWQDPIQGYGSESVARLKDTSKKYDPGQIFQRLASNGFKLG